MMMNDTGATPAKIRVGLIGVGNWANHGQPGPA
jgi:hypothetical protein